MIKLLKRIMKIVMIRILKYFLLMARCCVVASQSKTNIKKVVVVFIRLMLCTIWKSVNADYRAALNGFIQSGRHENCFYAFCNRKVETDYLHKYLEVRPNTNATVKADLPEERAISSNRTQNILSSASKTGEKHGTNELVEAIPKYSISTVGSEVAKQGMGP